MISSQQHDKWSEQVHTLAHSPLLQGIIKQSSISYNTEIINQQKQVRMPGLSILWIEK